ncbi:hypothetical protein FHS32_003102 [Streptomyces albaduncus]|uniref:Uncharacterized protein n=1 Tax=Streptomyces griseoloalbus TaxID=67303 RepID=A0A7W8F9N1_9ACTN|nr:hypothetical protein [Streptomyces albaduncus]
MNGPAGRDLTHRKTQPAQAAGTLRHIAALAEVLPYEGTFLARYPHDLRSVAARPTFSANRTACSSWNGYPRSRQWRQVISDTSSTRPDGLPLHPGGVSKDMPHPHESLVLWGILLVSMLLLRLAARDLFALNARHRLAHLAARWVHFQRGDSSDGERSSWARSLVSLAEASAASRSRSRRPKQGTKPQVDEPSRMGGTAHRVSAHTPHARVRRFTTLLTCRRGAHELRTPTPPGGCGWRPVRAPGAAVPWTSL